MRFVGLASLVLATVLGASNASAGLVLIDDFNVTPDIGGTRATPAPGSIDTGTGRWGVNAVSFVPVSTEVYSLTGLGGLDLSKLVIELTDAQYASSYGIFGNLTMTLTPTVGTAVTRSVVLDSSKETYSFDFRGEAQLASISSISIGYNGINSNFSFDTLQAVPEPTTVALLGMVGVGGGFSAWRKRRAARKG